jgi:hypothetical protein
VRATDTASQTVDSDSFAFTIAAATGTIDLSGATKVFKNNAGSVLASKDVTLWVHHATTGALIMTKTDTTDASGNAANITDAELADSTLYRVDWKFSTGEFGCGFFTSEA